MSSLLGLVAASFGYALFWLASLTVEQKRRFFLSCVWFAGVQAVQLSWMTSTVYMGLPILIVYLFLLVGMGVQFGLLTCLIRFPLRTIQIAGLAGFWTLMEWVRLFFLTGFTWNPVGLALSGNSLSIQFSALFGIYGLCFWVMWVNLFALRAFYQVSRNPVFQGGVHLPSQLQNSWQWVLPGKKWIIWVAFAALPYCYGAAQKLIVGPFLKGAPEIEVALIQTGMLPEQRDQLAFQPDAYIHPLIQWDRILSHLAATESEHFDLIVLPEGALPGGAKSAKYSLESVEAIWQIHFGKQSFVDFPPLSMPFGKEVEGRGWRVSNAFWMQSLANHYGAQIVVGLDDGERGAQYNAAFHFIPHHIQIERYEKQILIPAGEYIPFGHWRWVARFFAEKMGVEASFQPGQTSKIFWGALPVGIFICLEETYSRLVREVRQRGASVFVSISNDVWFPRTGLPWHHFYHGRIRAAEHGLCLLRSCNTGVTAAIDCFGEPIKIFPVSEEAAGVLSLKIPLQSYSTLYTFLGDGPLILVSGIFFSFLIVGRLNWKKKLL